MTASPIPAATLVIVRPDPSGSPPRLLMVERAATMAFAGGAMVFPGGRVDPGDHAMATADPDPDDRAARIAAIRETVEEVGLAIALDPSPAADVLAAIRRGLHRGQPFATLLAEAEIAIRPERLVPFARWCPSHAVSRVFDTRFYLAEMPHDCPEPTVDATENVRLIWTGAAAMLAAAAAGRATLLYPTRRILERLGGFASFADAAADAGRYPARTVTPWRETRDGVPMICIPDDLGYPVTAEPARTATRG